MQILTNVLSMFLTHADMDPAWENALTLTNVAFTSVYVVEMILKMLGIGFKAYFKVPACLPARLPAEWPPSGTSWHCTADGPADVHMNMTVSLPACLPGSSGPLLLIS